MNETMIDMGHIPGAFHNKRAVVCFADGHISTQQWQDERTFVPRKHGLRGNKDNPDLDWIRSHATEAYGVPHPDNNAAHTPSSSSDSFGNSEGW